jgi:trk system potassium uptake protein TrkH
MNEGNGFRSLIYAVRLPVIARLLGRLALVLAILCLPSLIVALWFHEFAYLPTFTMIVLPLIVAGWLTRRLPDPTHLMRSEGFVVICAAFILAPLLMAVALEPSGLPLSGRIFEAVSAVTTTGLSIVLSPGDMHYTFLFTRSWMQWFGGLGIVVLSVVFLLQRSTAAYQLLDMPEGQGFVSAAVVYARRILLVYLFLSVLAVLVCWWCFGDFFTGMIHGFSAISTGGFASREDSLASLSFAAQFGVVLLCVMGAVSLSMYLRLWRHAWRDILRDQEFRWFFGLLLALCVILTLLGWWQDGSDLESAAETGVIMGFSALSTAGFANVNLAESSAAFKLVLIVSMFLGGCVGSTAGGFKIFRLIIVWQLLKTLLRRASAAQHAVIEPGIRGHKLTQEQIQGAMLTGCLLAVLIVMSWFPFLLYGYAPLDALFEVVSAVGTVGLSSGITAPDLPLFLKTVLCIDMIAGRVEVVALVCLFYPGVWLGNRNPL